MSEKKLRDEVRRVAAELVDLQRRLYEAQLIRTAHAVNKASKELGWEAAERFERIS